MASWSRRSTAIGARSSSSTGAAMVKARRSPNGVALLRRRSTCMQATRDSIRAIMMIRAYRMRGHLHADLDPLEAQAAEDRRPSSIPATYGFTEADYDRKIFIDNVLGLEFAHHPGDAGDPDSAPIARRSASSSCTSPIPRTRPGSRSASRAPTRRSRFTAEGKKAILNKLIEAEGFEKFLDVKYTGTKRFGLDGVGIADPGARADHQARRRARREGHRARHGASRPAERAHPGDGASRTAPCSTSSRAARYYSDDVEGSGDVKYHLGASSDREFDGNKVHLSLTANPSHLEIVDPVVLGKARAKQDQRSASTGTSRRHRAQTERAVVMPLLHPRRCGVRRPGRDRRMPRPVGPRGHRTGGSVHFIINNQIGFTTNPPMISRSSPYPTDVAKMIEAPVFHVNGDDPEAVVYVSQGRDRVPAALRQAGGHRHVLLPPLRPQRRRRAELHPAADVLARSAATRRRWSSIPSGWSARACSPPTTSTR